VINIALPVLSVIGMTCKSVKRGAVDAVSTFAGLPSAVARPNDPF
jgi:hypothetical protein